MAGQAVIIYPTRGIGRGAAERDRIFRRIFEMVEVVGVEPTCPWALRTAPTVIVKY